MHLMNICMRKKKNREFSVLITTPYWFLEEDKLILLSMLSNRLCIPYIALESAAVLACYGAVTHKSCIDAIRPKQWNTCFEKTCGIVVSCDPSCLAIVPIQNSEEVQALKFVCVRTETSETPTKIDILTNLSHATFFENVLSSQNQSQQLHKQILFIYLYKCIFLFIYEKYINFGLFHPITDERVPIIRRDNNKELRVGSIPTHEWLNVHKRNPKYLPFEVLFELNRILEAFRPFADTNKTDERIPLVITGPLGQDFEDCIREFVSYCEKNTKWGSRIVVYKDTYQSEDNDLLLGYDKSNVHVSSKYTESMFYAITDWSNDEQKNFGPNFYDLNKSNHPSLLLKGGLLFAQCSESRTHFRDRFGKISKIFSK
ncbi:hypothetical protein RFI_15680 [Reticulomyxa filosa]|uniref:Uncharacterized protein n=1 Tax=Reticulomyxa filosa TaxID=46433 RepID=X6N701_RETFI|nr:hypothetical protein RFI_15680 [Reticulomyxa filosa]|eukprot:ETO21524.1 hypothetical protein RFI_15680 [Reticulomyxa filosa]